MQPRVPRDATGAQRNPPVGVLIESTDEVDVVLRDGSTVHLRPARGEDRAALRDFYEQLSPESRYFRFFGKPRVDDIVEDVLKAAVDPTDRERFAELMRLLAFPTER